MSLMALPSSEHPSVKQSGRRVRLSQGRFLEKLMHKLKQTDPPFILR